ncbi:MAG: glycosyl hydrolase 2 galactose-binding domain-containing protein, partial [Planctomycetota bacterium]
AQLQDLAAAELVCAGLDTLATVWINEVQVLQADNMFRSWRTDVAAALQAGTNRIRVRCHSTLPAIAAGSERRRLREWNNYRPVYNGRGWIRKMSCSYGWDWGPMLPTCGIWGAIGLELRRGAGIAEVHLRQDHDAPGAAVDLHCRCRLVGGPEPVTVVIRDGGRTVASATIPAGTQETTLRIPEAR